MHDGDSESNEASLLTAPDNERNISAVRGCTRTTKNFLSRVSSLTVIVSSYHAIAAEVTLPSFPGKRNGHTRRQSPTTDDSTDREEIEAGSLSHRVKEKASKQAADPRPSRPSWKLPLRARHGCNGGPPAYGAISISSSRIKGNRWERAVPTISRWQRVHEDLSNSERRD